MSERIVVKIGGELLVSGEIHALGHDVRKLTEAGHRVAIVHGGGVQAGQLQERLGIPVNKVAGRRITDEATLDVMKMTLAGQVNVDICGALLGAGCRPVGLHGASSLAIEAVKRPPRVVSGGGPDPIDFGQVGDVQGCNVDLVERLWEGGYLPVLASLGANAAGAVFNINADTVASRVARSLGASRLFLVTGVPGVLTDLGDPTTRLERLSPVDAQKAIADGVITGGMIPKVEEAMESLQRGVGAVHIVGNLDEGDLLREMQAPGTVGTALIV